MEEKCFTPQGMGEFVASASGFLGDGSQKCRMDAEITHSF